MPKRESRACYLGNHSLCVAKSCRCSCHRPERDYSGACLEGDHSACRLDDCSCPHHREIERAREREAFEWGHALPKSVRLATRTRNGAELARVLCSRLGVFYSGDLESLCSLICRHAATNSRLLESVCNDNLSGSALEARERAQERTDRRIIELVSMLPKVDGRSWSLGWSEFATLLIAPSVDPYNCSPSVGYSVGSVLVVDR